MDAITFLCQFCTIFLPFWLDYLLYLCQHQLKKPHRLVYFLIDYRAWISSLFNLLSHQIAVLFIRQFSLSEQLGRVVGFLL
jgi:hypothetical protein